MIDRFWIALSIVQRGQSLNTVLNMKEKKRENFEEIRAYIKARYKLGLNGKDIYGEICDIFGSNKVSYRTVLRWIARFGPGQESLKDNAKYGRPKTSSSKLMLKKSKKFWWKMEDILFDR